MSEERKSKGPTWPALRDKFALMLVKAKDWQDADLIATVEEMSEHLSTAFPGFNYWPSDIPLALHDLNIPYERNEHNNKYYYLAKWK